MPGSELLTTDQMARADRLAVEAGVPSLALMENAGRAVADAAMAMVKPGARVHVFCGPGNNGGDGFVAARLLAERGFRVTLGLLCDRSALKGDAAVMAGLWTGEVLEACDFDAGKIDLYIDALFGAGLSRPLDDDIGSEILTRIRDDDPVLAVDVPSGLDGNTGLAEGSVFSATRTVTFFRKKPGHLLMPGRMFCGEVIVADIGIPDRVLTVIDGPITYINDEHSHHWRGWLPIPSPDGHKYNRGHAVVVSGGPEKTGAARLGARAALRVGAGLVTIVGSAAATMINAAQSTAVMVKSASGRKGLAEVLKDERHNAVLIGPGLGVGSETVEWVLEVLASRAAAVLDADALTSFASAGFTQKYLDNDFDQASGSFGFLGKSAVVATGPDVLFSAIAARRVQLNTKRPEQLPSFCGKVDKAAVILTPHEGEFARLFPDAAGSKLDRARAAAAQSGAIVILKGADTVIAAPDGRAAINANAPPWLATAGSGDVLAGIVTGLLAQGMPAYEAACAAVWMHGEAATAFGPGLIAEDLPEMLPRVLAKPY
ncbi:MAG: NAD(P)H-hydrate epimerase [Hyphomicrobium sp. 32-62-53]|nr:MAG: NAD(P)H-hydrate epimerase [Hyphomicrobium sp. 12-62-95]OYX98742.1 MAG: NAD(P)H-hydrate epimerase [Hyphomicrobium sp. 32-62-53]